MLFMDVIKKILIFALIIICGVFLYNHFAGEKAAKPNQEPVSHLTVINDIPVSHEQDTTVRYVTRAPDDNAQVDIKTEAPAIVVRANEKEYTMPSTVKETAAFENGQLKIKQETTAKIDVTQVVNEQMEQERKRLKKEHQRKETQKTFWGIVGGMAIGALLK